VESHLMPTGVEHYQGSLPFWFWATVECHLMPTGVEHIEYGYLDGDEGPCKVI